MPARMPRRLLVLLCLAVLGGGAAACGEALELQGIEYNVFITRELNTRIPPDDAYVEEGTEPNKDETLYGVFLQACNRTDEAHQSVDRFKIVDNQGNEFEPEELPEDNKFAYHAKELLPDECIPEAGSVAQLGPTAGAMLLFRLPLANTEYRPLELEIEGTGEDHLTYKLDI
jgi:hypothetical protein